MGRHTAGSKTTPDTSTSTVDSMSLGGAASHITATGEVPEMRIAVPVSGSIPQVVGTPAAPESTATQPGIAAQPAIRMPLAAAPVNAPPVHAAPVHAAPATDGPIETGPIDARPFIAPRPRPRTSHSDAPGSPAATGPIPTPRGGHVASLWEPARTAPITAAPAAATPAPVAPRSAFRPPTASLMIPTTAAPSMRTGPIDIVAQNEERRPARSVRRLAMILPAAIIIGCVGGAVAAPSVQRALGAELTTPLPRSTAIDTPDGRVQPTPATSSGIQPSTDGVGGGAASAVRGAATTATATQDLADPTGPTGSTDPTGPGGTANNPSASASSDPRPSNSSSPDPSSSSPSSSEPSPTGGRSSATTNPSPSSAPSSVPTSMPSSSPTPTPSTTTAPPASGGVASFRAAITGSGASLGAGTYTMNNFASSLLGADMTGRLVGAGSDSTVVKMTPHSSTKAGSVPKKAWTTNQLSLIRIQNASTIKGFTLQATDQDHLYNGLRISRSSGTDVSDVRVLGVPGGDDIPPGETFGINDFHTNGTTYSNVEVDGNGSGAANFGANSSSNVTISNSYFHDSGHANGVTFWQTRNVTVRNTRSTGNFDTGFNFERVSGTVLLDHVTVTGNKLADLRIDSDQGSAVYRIVDPVFSGKTLDILMTPKYMGSPNLQKKSDVHVIMHGVDVTDQVVRWVDHF